MTKEVQRVNLALNKAKSGFCVCLISSGDPGVYGMAGLAFELLGEGEQLLVEVIPGLTAASSCAALLGAPLMHDYVNISLSDRLTDKDLILKRVKLAVEGDFVIVLYNPRSRSRIKPFAQACEILLTRCRPDTPVGIVRNAYRKNQSVKIIQLQELKNHVEDIDMFTTIIVGNSTSFVKNRRMVTPRGYLKKIKNKK